MAFAWAIFRSPPHRGLHADRWSTIWRRSLVARRRMPNDTRAVLLHVTAAGRRLTRRVLPIAERYERWHSRF